MRPTLLAAIAVFLILAAGSTFVRVQRGSAAHAQNALAGAAPTPAKPVPKISAIDQDAPYRESCARQGLSESECVGRLIWFKTTAGNERFDSCTFQQRIGVLIDRFRVLRADQRDDPLRAWGIISDPACCKTYGVDWCPVDDSYVGKSGYTRLDTPSKGGSNGGHEFWHDPVGA